MNRKEKLFDMFPPVTTGEWMDKIISDLKGADYDKKLVWRTSEGLDIKPFYRSEDISALPSMRIPNRRDRNSWLVRQDVIVKDYSQANRKALKLLMNGIDSLGFVITDPETVNINNFRILLERIHIDAVEINFLSSGKAKEILEIITELLKERNLSKDSFAGGIEADPLGRLMMNGDLCIPVEQGLDYLAELTRASIAFTGMKTIHTTISKLANAGADIVQELAFAMSIGNEYLAALTERGIAPEDASSKIRFSFASGSNYFFEIAKLRAARVLWDTVLREYMKENKVIPEMSIHSVTSRLNKTIFDPHVNMLRTQTEAMAAVLGGADSLLVEPFDISFRKPDDFSERIAMNQQLILMEEAGFARVSDPSAGSYYIEKLTAMLAESAWKMFLDYEAKGGFLACLKNGLIQASIKEAAKKKMKDAASRKITILGTNQYPNNRETAGSFDPLAAFSKTGKQDKLVSPLTEFRLAEEYEIIRLSVERSGREPKVFLFTIGNPVMRRARSQFSAVFFGCAGYRIIDNNGFESVEHGVEAALASGAEIVVICSSDEEYQAFAVEIFKQLSKNAIVVIAGNPACADELKKTGIENFIHVKSDVTAVLRNFNEKLGIETITLTA
ncbi:MAG TPA: methylmalonyl-CoA mutase family protein [Bacteroidales bacterium]|nr:methylmalonyl-CoA mutase family protein [Bacteroidales bacterium]